MTLLRLTAACVALAVLPFSLAACGAVRSLLDRSTPDYDELVVADILLTTEDLNAIQADVWTEDSTDDTTLNAFACGVDCGTRTWRAPRAALSVTVSRQASEEAAEAVFGDIINRAVAEVGYAAEATDFDIEGADRIWLGIAREGDVWALGLLSRRGPVVVMTLMQVGRPELTDQDRQALTLILFDITASQWEKMLN